MDERQKAVNEAMSRFDGYFAEIALAKGYATQVDLAVVRGRRTDTEDGAPFPMTLPQVALRHKLMDYDQVDEILTEMFDSFDLASRASELNSGRSIAVPPVTGARLAG